jgi:hypothetical protein
MIQHFRGGILRLLFWVCYALWVALITFTFIATPEKLNFGTFVLLLAAPVVACGCSSCRAGN